MSSPGTGRDDARPRVLILRPADSGAALVQTLAAQGLAPEHHPLIELVPEPPHTPTGRSLGEAVGCWLAGDMAWLALTSPVAIDALDALVGGSWPSTSPSRIAVVGRGTAETLRERGLEPDLVAHGSGASLVAEMPDPEHPGSDTVLLPASAAAAPTVPTGLAERGYTVRQEIAYRPRQLALPEGVAADLRAGAYAAVVLTSGSIARAAAAIGVGQRVRVVTIGGPTSAAARSQGLTVAAQAAEPSTEGLAAAVLSALGAG